MIDHLDHLVLTVHNLQSTIDFYTRTLGMRHAESNGRHALHFGGQKINLHEHGHEFDPKARLPTPGSADLCFILTEHLDAVIAHLKRSNISIIEGPIERTGATGKLRSIYLRDPDGNLIELSNPLTSV